MRLTARSAPATRDAVLALSVATVGLIVAVRAVVGRSLGDMLESLKRVAATASAIVVAFPLGAGWVVAGLRLPTASPRAW